MISYRDFEHCSVRKSGSRGRLKNDRVTREVAEKSVGCGVFEGKRRSVSKGGSGHLCQMLLKDQLTWGLRIHPGFCNMEVTGVFDLGEFSSQMDTD